MSPSQRAVFWFLACLAVGCGGAPADDTSDADGDKTDNVGGQSPSPNDEGGTAGRPSNLAGAGGHGEGGHGGAATLPLADAAAPPDAPTNPIKGPPVLAGWKRAVVGVGYGGVRLLSSDEGVTWQKTGEDEAHGGDDGNLLRSVAFGKGVWVAGGWNKWHTSPNGKTWTTRAHNFGIMQGMAFGNDFFLASEMNGDIYKSQDGLAWQKVGHAGTGKHTELVFANGLFAAWGQDNSLVETSKDGTDWQRVSLKTVAYCGGPEFKTTQACFGGQTGAWQEGLWVKAPGAGTILRSVDGSKWVIAFRYPDNAVDAMAIGLVPE